MNNDFKDSARSINSSPSSNDEGIGLEHKSKQGPGEIRERRQFSVVRGAGDVSDSEGWVLHTFPTRLQFMSTGDVDKDKKFIDGFNRRDELIKAKKCPNGCGPMVAEQGTERCPQCGFIHVKVISGIRNWITR